MITTFLHWSDDISQAPKGEMVTTKFHQTVKGEIVERSRTEHVPTRILALTNCGKIVITYWRPAKMTQSGHVLEGDCWSGFVRGGTPPTLWAPMPNAAELLASHAATRPAYPEPTALEEDDDNCGGFF